MNNWHCRFKCTTSDPTRPAGGRLDPETNKPLFTPETKGALLELMNKVQYIEDPLPLEDMYDVIPPNKNAAHGLSVYLSRRGDSKLESYHCASAHFANTGMAEGLADDMNLQGTAHKNMDVRHKLALKKAAPDEREDIPAGWEETVSYYNHSELQYVNKLAADAGAKDVPFLHAETLGQDTIELFFSKYLHA